MEKSCKDEYLTGIKVLFPHCMTVGEERVFSHQFYSLEALTKA